MLLLLGKYGQEDDLFTRIAPLTCALEFDDSNGSLQRLYYVSDEFGSRIESTEGSAAGSVNVRCEPVLDYSTGATFTVVWPAQNIACGEHLMRAVHTKPSKLFWGKGYWTQRSAHLHREG